MGQIITFYSYKGGTGRSMALANIACLLAQRYTEHSKVLMIDWDLEAPGLHMFFDNQLKNEIQRNNGDLDSHPGLIDLFCEFRDMLTSLKKSGDENAEQFFENFENYVLKTDIPRLHFIKAGIFSDEKYTTR